MRRLNLDAKAVALWLADRVFSAVLSWVVGQLAGKVF